MFSKFQNNLQVPQVSDKETPIKSQSAVIQIAHGTILEIKPEQRITLIKNLVDQKSPLIWVCLEGEDHDPGRFWLKFLASLRKVVPHVGEEILACLLDHHTQPLFNNVIKVLEVIQQKYFTVILENISYIQTTPWWRPMLQTIEKQGQYFAWVGINYQPIDMAIPGRLTQEVISGLLGWDVFWYELLEQNGLKLSKEDINTLFQEGFISFLYEKFSIPIGGWADLSQSGNAPKDKKEIESQLSTLANWLMLNEEWLEGFRALIALKEFEQAGDILENYGEIWLEEGFNRLELLFWLRELPSVLLEARPQLCWLAAKACKDLNLKFLMSYYINHAENTLASFSRFSRNHDQWMQIEINDSGLKVGTLFEKLTQLKD